ncbi:FAD/NAD(P)-binding domain-containing protein [Mycena capillaripes]|nr:FAD/NAD(P)-binding domain-containing protein [Mycena capillaripes]
MASSMNPEEILGVATRWLASLGAATNEEAFAGHFLPTGWLRDLLCFSWDFRTMAGRSKIVEFLADPTATEGKSRFERAGLHDFQIEATSTLPSPGTFPSPGNPDVQGISAPFTFSVSSPPAKGRGFFRIVTDSEGSWKAYTLLTNLEDLVGHEESSERPLGYLDTTWEEVHAKKIAEIENDPTVLIIGGGQSGLMCAARFWRRGIRALVIEKTRRVGDVWRNRKTYPKFLPKEKFADFLEAYAVGQEIHVWLSSTIVATPTYDNSTGRWARIPTLAGRDSFSGRLYHSDDHKGAAPFKGKRAIVVGACNAAADICQDFVLKGAAEVTMVQRSATCVISYSTADKTFFNNPFYESLAVEDADFMSHSTPYALTMKLATGGATQRLKNLDQKLHADLAKTGFKLTWELTSGGGEVGLAGFFFQRSVLDMGCSQLIIEGKIKIKQGVAIETILSDGVVFKDGTKLVADVIVLATGNEPIIENAVSIFGEGIKGKIGSKIGGLDDEGELKRFYRPTGAPGLWFAPGAFQHSRFFSKHLANQILAEELGLKV